MIKILRGVTVVLLFVLFGFGALFIRYLIFPFQKNKSESYITLQKTWAFFIWIIKTLKIIELKIDDLEKIKNIKNSIIVSTHPSFIDIVILMSIIPKSTCFVAEKLTRNFFLKGIVNYLFIPEGQSVDIWLNECCKKIDDGFNVIIFPMGGRHKNDETPKIRRGTALIAQKSGKSIVVLNIKTDKAFLQNGQTIYDASSEPVLFIINYLGEIDTNYYLNNYKDDVTIKTELTRQISKILYSK